MRSMIAKTVHDVLAAEPRRSARSAEPLPRRRGSSPRNATARSGAGDPVAATAGEPDEIRRGDHFTTPRQSRMTQNVPSPISDRKEVIAMNRWERWGNQPSRSSP